MRAEKLTPARLFIYATLILAVGFFLLPACFALVNSFKPLEEIQSGNQFGLPQHWTLDAWYKAWASACTGSASCDGLSVYAKNSLIMAIPSTLVPTLWGCFNGYVLSKWRFKGTDLIFFLLLFGTFLPAGLFLLPLSMIVNSMGLGDSLSGLIVVHILYSLPITLYFRNYLVGFPGELIKAARIDGAGLFTIFWRIVLPAATPILVVVLIMQFTAVWNDFLFALVLSPSDQQTVTVGLNNLTSAQHGTPEYNVYMAAAFIAAAPTILIYILAGKYFVRGLVAGAVKG
ncbi:carbohydrate ABC transporter permease [Burkholderia sp. LMG 21824]|uniref:carbohydrate ABC transporter permease n=1 Tax=Burkholderia sp. LMG 21824 TaxID=3158172 RepID=UPI003C2DEF6F